MEQVKFTDFKAKDLEEGFVYLANTLDEDSEYTDYNFIKYSGTDILIWNGDKYEPIGFYTSIESIAKLDKYFVEK